MQVSYSLLVFFSGMFISVEGFNATKVPEKFWNAVEPYSRINSTGGIAVLSLIITVLSNVASNVPTGKSSFFYSITISFFLEGFYCSFVRLSCKLRGL